MAKDEKRPFVVGQEVVIQSVNSKPRRATVSKVGRTLVTVGRGGSDDVFRLEDRRTNDAYRHGTLFTVDEWTERCEREDLTRSLSMRGLQFYHGLPGWISTACLRDMVDVLYRHHPAQKGVSDGDA